MNGLKEINIKNCMHYFFEEMINIKNPDSYNIKIEEKSFKNILI